MWIKRFLDIFLALVVLTLAALPMVLIALLVRLTSKGPAIYWSDRVGKDNVIFPMPKFRTMRVGAPEIGMHLIPDAESCLTPIGRILRTTSLDEFPQLFSILRGHMSFVGPRPVLPNDSVLVAMRTLREVHRVKPGLTGWAQINGRAELKLHEKLQFDIHYTKKRSLLFDLKIMVLTGVYIFRRAGVEQDKVDIEPLDVD